MTDCAILPCSSTTTTPNYAFEIINYDDGAIKGIASGDGTAIYGETLNGIGIIGKSSYGTAIFGKSSSSSENAKGIYGQVSYVHSNPGSAGVYGENEGQGPNSYGVWGSHNGYYGIGVYGSNTGWGGYGVYGFSENAVGVYGSVYNKILGWAGLFDGDVWVQGRLAKQGGGFQIDHPLDPANKYLNHFFVESSEMKNLYDGVITLDENGEAVIELPEWFEALNQDFRYQLTCIGKYAPVYVAQKVERSRLRNSFKIAGGISGMEVSWQVTGIRKDAWAKAHSMTVEQEKSSNQKRYHLYSEAYDQSEEKR